MASGYVLAVDQGTSATKCVLLDPAGRILRSASAPLPIAYPRPGWVEQRAEDVLESVFVAASSVLEDVSTDQVLGVGLSTQRESALLWDRATGKPLDALLGWQDQRSATVARRRHEHSGEILRITGLALDPMFSAAKLTWLLDQHDPDRSLSRSGRLAVGTVDSWLMFALTGQHVIEAGNASRTQLLDLATGQWSPWLMELFGIPEQVLPEVISSEGKLGTIAGGPLARLEVKAILGDSHAALFAHGRAGDAAKATYGTGSSVMRLSAAPAQSVGRTIAWADPAPVLALEGNIRSSGSTLTWLAELFQSTPERLSQLAASSSSEGVHIVPAFGGLAAPWWDDNAKGLISGVTLGTRLPQLARAALESIALQVDAVVRAMDGTTAILADGGATASDGLMQLQADISSLPVRRARERDLSAIGAGLLAARSSWGELHPLHYDDFHPAASGEALREAWSGAVRKSRLDGEWTND
jgi:glycerol kinase